MRTIFTRNDHRFRNRVLLTIALAVCSVALAKPEIKSFQGNEEKKASCNYPRTEKAPIPFHFNEEP